MQVKASVLAFGVIITLVVILSRLFPGLFRESDVRSAARLTVCKQRMLHIYEILRAYARERGEFPKDDNGVFTPNHLLCSETNIERACLSGVESQCSLQSEQATPWAGYVWCKEPEEQQLADFILGRSDAVPFIILCHECSSVHRVGDRRSRSVLLSDGRVIRFDLEDDKYCGWLDNKFRRGDTSVPEFMRESIESRVP